MGTVLVILGISIAVLFLLIKHIVLIRQIRSLTNQIRDPRTDFVTVDFIDRDLEALAAAVNAVIDEREAAKIEGGKNHRILQQSIANISHDMRTPLTSVIGYLQLAMKSSSGQQLSDLKVALERAGYCNRLIDDFYELSVAEARDKLPQFERIDLSALLCDQILGNYVAFEARRLMPDFPGSEKQMWVTADRVMLTRVLQNLISNALKYAAGRVDFRIEEYDTHMTKLTVSNPVVQDGIDTEAIFQKFYQSDLSRGNSGSGIGLYLCRCFVEKMGGSISAQRKDGILTITVLLKKAEEDAPPKDAARP